MDSYDTIPYPSLPLPRSHPNHLAALARLAGVTTAAPDTGRLLELGCASGGNLIPMAAQLPKAFFMGVERSVVQARQGQEAIQRLGLKNCVILHQDLMELTGEEGPFDTIIVHGLYSWVPEAVGAKILALCGQLLAPRGVALVSFNTLPGWHLRGMLREMLLEQTRHLQDPRQRLARAQSFLATLELAMGESPAHAARHLTLEIQRLRQTHVAYLYHEYLEEENHPLLLRDFIAHAAHHGLQYLCDADATLWFPHVLGQQAQSLLGAIADPLEREQMQDFFMMRNFREAILCRNDLPIQRELDLTALEGLAVYASLSPPPRLLLHQQQPQPFLAPDGSKRPISHPLTRAALALLWECHPRAMAWPDLWHNARQKVRQAGAEQRAEEGEHLAGELLGLFLRGDAGLQLLADPPLTTRPLHPLASALSRFCAEQGWLPTHRHDAAMLEAREQTLLALLNGQHTIDQLTQVLMATPGKTAPQLNRLRPWIEQRLELWHREGVFQ